ncbi:MAG: DegV family protein [Clostridia bacterium]|nr:DegV family protein [Clostridia bacterium]
MKIALSAESTIDMPANLLAEYDIHTTPFTILLGDEAKLDGEVPVPEIINYVNTSGILPKTSAVNEYQFKEHFDKLLQDYDAVIHFSLSSEISVACHNAKTCAQNYDNVFVIDTRSLSTGIALLAIYASKLIKKGFEPKQIVEKCEKRIPNLQVSFVLARLDYLHKGGRCSALSLFGANLLKLRLQILVKDGKMGPAKKYRGNMDNCIINYVNDTLAAFNNPDLSEVFITSTTASEAQVQSVKNILTEHGFKHIMVTYAGGTITSHCGENCLGILYLNDGEQED